MRCHETPTPPLLQNGVRYGIRTRILKLFHRFSRIGVLAYEDLCGPLSWPFLDETHINLVDRNGIEPFLKACKALVPPTTLTAQKLGAPNRNRTCPLPASNPASDPIQRINLAPRRGFDPLTSTVTVSRSPN